MKLEAFALLLMVNMDKPVGRHLLQLPVVMMKCDYLKSVLNHNICFIYSELKYDPDAIRYVGCG